MLTENVHKKFTACDDTEAELLLQRVLSEIKEALSGTGLCVFLGGSYGRGDGGVRQDRENGVLYNDLDFFVFARTCSSEAPALLKKVARKYEEELKVDVDFSAIMSIKEIKNNGKRLMMQELKRGYHLVCGEDLLEAYLPELPPEKLPFSEACRLLLNRGMGLLMAGAKIAGNSDDTDFILRNIYKAILGAGDAMLISSGEYRWQISQRLELIRQSDMPDSWKELYHEAVEFKHAPHRRKKQDMVSFWNSVRDFFQTAICRCSGAKKHNDLRDGIYTRCFRAGETSLKNYVKYCIKSRSIPLWNWKYHTIPGAAVPVVELCRALEKIPAEIDRNGKLYQHWLIFN